MSEYIVQTCGSFIGRVTFKRQFTSSQLRSIGGNQEAMALDRINRAIATLCSNHELTLPEGTTIRVCEATEDEWNAFIESEDHELKSIHLAWSDGQVFIVELPSPERGLFCSVFNRSFLHDDIVDDHLNSYMTAFVRTTQPRLEADLSYGPLAGPLPGELQSYWQWHTLKVEVGLTRRWGGCCRPTRLEGQAVVDVCGRSLRPLCGDLAHVDAR